MGASGKEFMKFRAYEEDYKSFPQSVRSKIIIDIIDNEDIDFSDDDLWTELKSKSNKAFKELKKREHYLKFDK